MIEEKTKSPAVGGCLVAKQVGNFGIFFWTTKMTNATGVFSMSELVVLDGAAVIGSS